MRWEIKKVYLYLVSFVTFIMCLFGGWSLVNRIVQYAVPLPAYDVCVKVPTPEPKDAQLCEQQRKDAEQRDAAMQTRQLIENVLFMAIVLPAYLYHWRQARRSEG